MMNIRTVLLITLLGMFAFTSMDCTFKRYDKREVTEYNIGLDGKTKVTLENFNGKIKVFKGDSASGLIIKAEKIAHVKKRELENPFTEAWISIDTSSEVVRINSEYEKSKGLIKFKFNDKDANTTRINYTITIPPGIKLSIDNVNGDIEFTNIENDLDVELLNGDVEVDNICGINKFDIANGKLKGTLDSTKGLKADILNGRVDLKLDSAFSANFNIDVGNGKIEYKDLNFETLQAEKKTLRGRIGDSNAEVKIDIANGRVILKSK
jgi:hypothetical protein